MNNTITFKGIIWADDYLERELPSEVNFKLTPDQVYVFNYSEEYTGPRDALISYIRYRISEIYQRDIRDFGDVDWADPSMLGIPTFEV